MFSKQLASTNLAAVDSLHSLAEIVLDSAQRLNDLNLKVVRSALENAASGTAALLAAKDVSSAIKAQSELLPHAMERGFSYPLSTYALSSEVQQKLQRLAYDNLRRLQTNAVGFFEKNASSFPESYESAMDALRKIIASSKASTPVKTRG